MSSKIRVAPSEGATTSKNKNSNLIKHTRPLKLRKTGQVTLTSLHEPAEVSTLTAAVPLLLMLGLFMFLVDALPLVFDWLSLVLTGGA